MHFAISPSKREYSSRELPTVERIQQEFLSLLARRPIEKISVAEICGRCEINRSTFYRHFLDVYDLLDSIVEKAHSKLFHDVIREVDPAEEFEDAGYQYILKVCDAAVEEKSLFRMLLFGKTPTTLKDRLIESVYDLFEQANDRSMYDIADSDLSLHYRFLANGLIGIWASWIEENCRLPKESIAQAAKNALTGFYNNMAQLYGK